MNVEISRKNNDDLILTYRDIVNIKIVGDDSNCLEITDKDGCIGHDYITENNKVIIKLN